MPQLAVDSAIADLAAARAGVRVCLSVQRIVAAAAVQVVVTDTTVEDVVAAVPPYLVVAAHALELVVGGAAQERVAESRADRAFHRREGVVARVGVAGELLEALLFCVAGSEVVAATDAVLAIEADVTGVTMILIEARAPLAMVPTAHVSGVVVVQETPVGATTDCTRTPVGSASVTLTPAPMPGPRFVMVTVYSKLLPTLTLAGAFNAIARSVPAVQVDGGAVVSQSVRVGVQLIHQRPPGPLCSRSSPMHPPPWVFVAMARIWSWR
jgi:hypothetical protein